MKRGIEIPHTECHVVGRPDHHNAMNAPGGRPDPRCECRTAAWRVPKDRWLTVSRLRHNLKPVVLRLPTRAVSVVDTIGAGDAFTAGLLTRLGEAGVTSRAELERLSSAGLAQALQFAALVAALTCARAGADPPRRDELEAYLGAMGRLD